MTAKRPRRAPKVSLFVVLHHYGEMLVVFGALYGAVTVGYRMLGDDYRFVTVSEMRVAVDHANAKRDCEDYNDRLDRATQALNVMPDDMVQQLLYTAAMKRLNDIDGCKVIVMPVTRRAAPRQP